MVPGRAEPPCRGAARPRGLPGRTSAGRKGGPAVSPRQLPSRALDCRAARWGGAEGRDHCWRQSWRDPHQGPDLGAPRGPGRARAPCRPCPHPSASCRLPLLSPVPEGDREGGEGFPLRPPCGLAGEALGGRREAVAGPKATLLPCGCPKGAEGGTLPPGPPMGRSAQWPLEVLGGRRTATLGPASPWHQLWSGLVTTCLA